MKTFFITAITLVAFNICFAQTDSLPINISIKINKEYVRTISKNSAAFSAAIQKNYHAVSSDSIKQKNLDVTIAIKNTSNKTIKIWLMTCAWENNFIVNNNYISIKQHTCDKNIPTLVELKPEESKVYKTTLIQSDKSPIETTKLALIIIDNIFKTNLNTSGYYTSMNDTSKWRLVWSNAL